MGEQVTTSSKLEQVRRHPHTATCHTAANPHRPAPVRNGANIWKQLLQRVPEGAVSQQPPQPASVDTLLNEAAKLAHHVDELRRTATTPLHDLGWRLVHGYRGPRDIVKCQTCGRTMLLAAFEPHRSYCRRRSREPTPTLSLLNNSTSMGGSEGSGREPSPGLRRASRATAPTVAGVAASDRPPSTATDPGPLIDDPPWRAPTPISATSPPVTAPPPTADTTELWGDQQLRFASRGQRSQPSRKRRKTMEPVNILTPPPPALRPAVSFERIPPAGKVTIGAAGVLAAPHGDAALDRQGGAAQEGMFDLADGDGDLAGGGLGEGGLEDDFLIDPMGQYDRYDQHSALLVSAMHDL